MVGEEQQVVMVITHKYMLNEVFVTHSCTPLTDTAATLSGILGRTGTLNQTLVRKRYDNLFVFDQIFDEDVSATGIIDFGSTLIRILIAHFQQLGPDDGHP